MPIPSIYITQWTEMRYCVLFSSGTQLELSLHFTPVQFLILLAVLKSLLAI